MCAINIFFNQKCAVFAHVIIWSQPLSGSRLRQTRNTVLENPPVVFANLQLLTRTVRRLKIPADAHAPIRINPPGKLDPELLFFPHFTQPSLAVRLISGTEFLALFFQRDTQHRLAKTDPAGSMGL